MKPAAPPADPAWADQARQWLDSGQAPDQAGLGGLAPQAVRALAWALKAECHRAWNLSPHRAQQAARWCEHLSSQPQADTEVRALAHWTRGLASLVGGQMDQALQRLDSAMAQFEQIDQGLHAAQAGVPTLMALSMMGRHDEAIARAQQIRQQLADGGDLLAAAKVDLNRGSMLLRLDRYPEAAASYRMAGWAFARAGDVEHSVMADIGLSTTLIWQSQFDEAERTLARARQRAQAHRLPVLEGLALGEWGQLALHRGQRREALLALENSRSLLAGRAHPQRLIEADRTLADAYLDVRMLPEARRLYQQVIDTARDIEAPLEAAWARVQLASTLILQRHASQAEAALELARQAFEAQGNLVGQARTELLRGQIALAAGESDLAGLLAGRAAAAFDRARAPAWLIEADLLGAQALSASGADEQAAARLEQLAAQAEQGGAWPQLPWCTLAQARVAERLGRTEAAVALYERAATLFEQKRRELPPGDFRVASALDAEGPADALVRLAARPGLPAQHLLLRMEQGRARSLHDHWAGPPSADAPGRRAAPDRAVREARTRLAWLHQQWQSALQAGPAQAERAAHLLSLKAQAELDWQAARRRALLEPKEPPGRSQGSLTPSGGLTQSGRSGGAVNEPPGRSQGSLTPSGGLDLAARQSALGPARALVSYHLDDEHWRACVVRDQRVEAFGGAIGPLHSRLQQLHFQLGAMKHPSAAGQRHAGQLLARVHKLLTDLQAQLIDPLRPALGGARQLVIVPHRGLHALPWAALRGPEPAPAAAETTDACPRHLIDEFEIVVAPSATTWLHCQPAADGPTRPRAPALVMGTGAGQLPAIAAELAAVAQSLGPGTRLRQDGEATLAAFLAEAGDAGSLHLACHASCRTDNPDLSALHFSDGPLTVADLSGLHLKAELVTLSACDTALSRVAPGDEVLGLARGFLMAGARSVVASLWSVEDGSTAALMAQFHRLRQSGLGTASALRQAQRELAARQPHPFFWGAFIACCHD